ncbi:TetR/AcrR family transcriptional regulator [Streptomyces sp. NPDC094038]|uniref:TetR/AcrR family transcriptional regulator n=1 Tax=Streptomyces sp. NPDC094038 TaxID=3366055 RepID=UPI00381DE9BF
MGAAGTGGGRRRGSTLTRERIIAAAVEISTAEGPAKVSFRSLGARLGVVATALYRLFRDKDELMLALADQIFVEMTDRFTPSGDWAADLHQIAQLGREVGVGTRWTSPGWATATRAAPATRASPWPSSGSSWTPG